MTSRIVQCFTECGSFNTSIDHYDLDPDPHKGRLDHNSLRAGVHHFMTISRFHRFSVWRMRGNKIVESLFIAVSDRDETPTQKKRDSTIGITGIQS